MINDACDCLHLRTRGWCTGGCRFLFMVTESISKGTGSCIRHGERIKTAGDIAAMKVLMAGHLERVSLSSTRIVV